MVGVGAYGADTIAFDIPGTGVRTIRPTSALPIITDPVTIDGYTQPGSAPNTNPVGQGLNGTLLIEIDGENAGDVRFGMLEFQTTDSMVRGLVINRTQGEKIGIDSVGTAGDIQIEGNYIGTDATGTAAFAASPTRTPTTATESSSGSRGNTIGGTTPAARNLISGNIGSYGVLRRQRQLFIPARHRQLRAGQPDRHRPHRHDGPRERERGRRGRVGLRPARASSSWAAPRPARAT